jgi:hypothetical protein
MIHEKHERHEMENLPTPGQSICAPLNLSHIVSSFHQTAKFPPVPFHVFRGE